MRKIKMAITEKARTRIGKNLQKYQNILKTAKDRDLNESNTVVIISDMLADIFGYDKYLEVTSEVAIKGTYCDLAIKVDGNFQFVIECKSIGTELKETHLRQVVDYGAKLGVSWIVLTNGIDWKICKIKFEQPLTYDLVCSFNFSNISAKKEEDLEKLFVLCKGGLSKDQRESFYEKTQCLNKFTLSAFILSDPIVSSIKKELRKYSDGLKIENEEIEKILKTDILKRDTIEGEESEKIFSKIKRYYLKLNKKISQQKEKQSAISEQQISQIVQEAENQQTKNTNVEEVK
jgi:hypothetical protein